MRKRFIAILEREQEHNQRQLFAGAQLSQLEGGKYLACRARSIRHARRPAGPTGRCWCERKRQPEPPKPGDIRGRLLVRLRPFAQCIGSVGIFFHGRPSAKRKTNGRSCVFHGQAHGEQNMRRPHEANHASRAARRANAFQTECHQHRFRINADKTYVERVGEPTTSVWIPILACPGKSLRQCASRDHHAIAFALSPLWIAVARPHWAAERSPRCDVLLGRRWFSVRRQHNARPDWHRLEDNPVPLGRIVPDGNTCSITRNTSMSSLPNAWTMSL